MIQVALTMEAGQDLPDRLQRWGDVELHAMMVRVATDVLAKYLPQLASDAPSGVKTVAGDVKLNESFTGRVIDNGLEVEADMYSAAMQKLTWITGGTRPHVIVPVDARALHFQEGLFEGTGFSMYAVHPGIRERNQFVNKIKDRIRSYVQYRFQQEIDVAVTRL